MNKLKNKNTKIERLKDIVTNFTCIMFCFSLSLLFTHIIVHKMGHSFKIDIFTLVVFLLSSFFVFLTETLFYLSFVIKKSKKIESKTNI